MFCSRAVLYVLLSTTGSIFETSWLAVDIKPLSWRQNRISGRLFILSFVCARFNHMLYSELYIQRHQKVLHQFLQLAGD